ncbi:MAG: uL13 family ribosomal protein, partial [Candidatus Paceibacterota bacterium]
EKKMNEKQYIRHSGYPGGQHSKSAREVSDKHGYGELLLRAVEGMLPKNKLQSRIMKNITVHE